MIKRLHHLNFIVHDLEESAPRFGALFGVDPNPVEELEGRGVRLCRFMVGETWVILIQPTDASGAPGRYLAEHGEGFFLASFEVDDLEHSVLRLAGLGFGTQESGPRRGLDDWLVQDLDPAAFGGIGLQLVETGD